MTPSINIQTRRMWHSLNTITGQATAQVIVWLYLINNAFYVRFKQKANRLLRRECASSQGHCCSEPPESNWPRVPGRVLQSCTGQLVRAFQTSLISSYSVQENHYHPRGAKEKQGLMS